MKSILRVYIKQWVSREGYVWIVMITKLEVALGNWWGCQAKTQSMNIR